jgi:hypothetical protein
MRKTLGAALLCIAALTMSACDRDATANSQASGGGAAGGVPNPAMTMPDQVAWSVFVEAVTPTGGKGTAFETWPSDGDTFNPNAKVITGGGGTVTEGLDQRAPIIPSVRRGTLPGGPKQPTGHVVGALGADTSAAAPAAAASGQPPIPNPLRRALRPADAMAAPARRPTSRPAIRERSRRSGVTHRPTITSSATSSIRAAG